MNGSYKVNEKEIPYEIKDLPQAELKFWVENPRVYSVIASNGVESQQEIEACMRKLEHVRNLAVAIKAHGGLVDPIVVKDGEFVVLEGNSRLAAYRKLFEEDPVAWGKIKCHVVPADIKPDDIFELLGVWHISGKTEWSPYEQAAFLSRQLKISKKPLSSHAKSLGLKEPTAKMFVATYEFMVEHKDDNTRHWSHYHEFLKNRAIERYREQVPELTETIVSKIKNGEILDAKDIRKLGDLAKVKTKNAKKIMQRIAKGEISIYDGYERVKESGAMDDVMKKIEKFRVAICDDSFEAQCLTHKNRDKIRYEVKNITKTLSKLLEKISKLEKAEN